MEEIVRAKFFQREELKEQLLATGDTQLCVDATDCRRLKEGAVKNGSHYYIYNNVKPILAVADYDWYAYL